MALTMTFNGKSSNEFVLNGKKWLHIARRPVIPSPAEDVKLVKVPGRDGALTVRDGTFAPIDITVTLSFNINPTEYLRHLDAVATWLLDPAPSDPYLKFSYKDNGYRVLCVKMGDLSYEARNIARLPVTFTCEALPYYLNGGTLPVYGQQYELGTSFRLEVNESLPLKAAFPYSKVLYDFNVSHAGAVYLYNQNKGRYFRITLPTTGHIYVDSDLMITYRVSGGQKINLSSCVDGDYEDLWRKDRRTSWNFGKPSGSDASATVAVAPLGRFYV